VIRAWQVWWCDLEPTAAREQAGKRPVVVVSSAFHLALTHEDLLTVLPLTSRERRQWLHRVPVAGGARSSWVITEQLRTIARSRLFGTNPAWVLSPAEIVAVRQMLTRMLDL
jgi:mRNA interferase MazF